MVMRAHRPFGDLRKKAIAEYHFKQENMECPDPFDGNAVLRRLFPGQWYDLRAALKNKNRLINWGCPACKQVAYPDASMEDSARFPYREGVATRLIKVFSYADDSGRQYKLMSFNHSHTTPSDEVSSCLMEFFRRSIRLKYWF